MMTFNEGYFHAEKDRRHQILEVNMKGHKLESRLPGEIINNLRYADDTTLMAESEEELILDWQEAAATTTQLPAGSHVTFSSSRGISL